MPPLPADSIHARACKLKCEKILTRPTPDSMDLPLHLELPGFRIQVIPLEGADHTPAQAGGQLGEKVPPHLVLLNGLQKGAQLSPIQNLLWEVIGL